MDVPGDSLLYVLEKSHASLHKVRKLTELSLTALSTTVLAEPEPVPSLELIERQTSNSTNVSAATWIYEGRNGDRDGDDRGNFTFTITVNPDNDDMWFRMAAPAMYSWIGIGAGTSMGNAKAFFMAWEGSGEDCMAIPFPELSVCSALRHGESGWLIS